MLIIIPRYYVSITRWVLKRHHDLWSHSFFLFKHTPPPTRHPSPPLLLGSFFNVYIIRGKSKRKTINHSRNLQTLSILAWVAMYLLGKKRVFVTNYIFYIYKYENIFTCTLEMQVWGIIKWCFREKKKAKTICFRIWMITPDQ